MKKYLIRILGIIQYDQSKNGIRARTLDARTEIFQTTFFVSRAPESWETQALKIEFLHEKRQYTYTYGAKGK